LLCFKSQTTQQQQQQQQQQQAGHSRARALLLDQLGHAVSEALGKAGTRLHSNLRSDSAEAAAAAEPHIQFIA
jgi:hypothetical protein